MILHTLNKPPSNTELSQQLSQVIGVEDSVLLIEDGVYQLLASERLASDQHWSSKAKHIYALIDDVKARGIDVRVIDTNTVNTNIINTNLGQASLVSYQQFVALVVEHDRVINWY